MTIIEPFFLQENFNGENYIQLLDEQLIPALEVNGQLPNNIWFQQYGALPDYARIVRNRLDRTFYCILEGVVFINSHLEVPTLIH